MLLQAADRLNCKPWELDDVPVEWIWRAQQAARAEMKAEQAAAKRAQRKVR